MPGSVSSMYLLQIFDFHNGLLQGACLFLPSLTIQIQPPSPTLNPTSSKKPPWSPRLKATALFLNPCSIARSTVVMIQFTWFLAVSPSEVVPCKPDTWSMVSIGVNLGNSQWQDYAGDKHGFWTQRRLDLNPFFPRVPLGKALKFPEPWFPENNTVCNFRGLYICCLNKSWSTYMEEFCKM